MTVSRDVLEAARLENVQARQAGTAPATPAAQQTLEFRFPMPMNIANRSGRKTSHWAVEHNAKKQYWAVCDVMERAGLFPPCPSAPFVKVAVHSVMRLGHEMDEDNSIRRHKWVLDWLKTRKYIVDDKRKHLRWTGLPEQIVGRKQDYTITLTVRPEK